MLDPALTTEEAAHLLRLKPRTLVVWRSRGGGPPYHLVGSRVVYMPEDIRAWLAERRRTSTSDPGPSAQAR